MRGVIVTANGDLIRAGAVNWTTDGSFDASTETERTDVPQPARVRGNRRFPNYHRWNGSAWVLRTDVNVGNQHTITVTTPFKISMRGEKVRHMRLNLEANAIINFLDAPEGVVLYLMVVQDATGGRTLIIRYDGNNTNVDYPAGVRDANDRATILMTRFGKRLFQVGQTNEV